MADTMARTTVDCSDQMKADLWAMRWVAKKVDHLVAWKATHWAGW